MKKLGLLMFACASIATPSLAHADPPPSDVDQPELSDASPGGASLDGGDIRDFHHIRLVNTNLCLQPRNRTVADAVVELARCESGVSAQNWRFADRTGGMVVINEQSKHCLYNDAPLPLQNGGREITQQSCGDSNTLWSLFSPAAGTTSLVSRVQFRDTHFCLDVPNGQPFETATMWMFGCNRTAAQQWVLGED